MRTETKNIYKFDELNKKAQEKAIENNRYINVDFGEWYHNLFCDFIENTKNNYGIEIEEKNIEFSGFNNQGDGASFTCDNINIEKLLKALNVTFKNEVLKKIFCDNVSIGIKRINTQYSHKYTVSCYCDYTELTYQSIIKNFIYTRIDNYLYNKSKELEKKLTDLKNKLCSELYEDLENEYKFLTSDSIIEDCLISNEYEFYSDGSIA